MPRSLIVEIFGEAKQFSEELDKAAGKTRSLGKMAGVAGLAIAGGLAYGLDKSVEAAMAAQTQTQALDQALHNAHITTTQFSGSLDDAEKQGRQFGFSNTDVREGLTKLVTATGDGKTAVADLATAEDLARFKHTSLAQASDTLTRAVGGSSRALKQLGIDVPAVTTHMDALRLSHMKTGTAAYFHAEATAKAADKAATGAARMQELNDKLHGQAAAYGDTAAGGMARFHASLENIEESLGTALLPALEKVTGALADGAAWLSQHATVAKILVGVIGALAAILITVSVATKIAAAAQTILNVAMDANPIGLIVIALAALAVGLVYAWQHSETFRNIVKGVFADIKAAGQWVVDTAQTVWHAFETALDWVKAHWPLLLGILTGPIGLAVEQIVTHWHDIVSAASSALNSVVNFFKALPGRILSALGDLGSLLLDAGRQMIEGMIHGMEGAAGSLLSKAGDLVSSVKNKLEFWKSPPFDYGQWLTSEVTRGMSAGFDQQKPTVAKSATDTVEYVKLAATGAFSGMDHMVSSAMNDQLVKAVDQTQPKYAAYLAKMLKDTTAQAVAGWSVAGDVAAAQAAASAAAATDKTNSDFNSLFNVDTQFAGKGWTPSLSAAQVYALQTPNVTVNVQGSVSTQQDLVKGIQAGLAQTASRNVTAGIN